MSERERAGGGRLRAEIQALRALAVAAVVVFHYWPAVLPGGSSGVDVFFVVSGFLITRGLVGEAESRGRPALAEFWARRARRLLPASYLTIALAAALVFGLAPATWRMKTLSDAAASAAYAQNWRLAFDAGRYWADKRPSALQHFWTLSMEEQFYLAWPLLIAAGFAARKRSGAAAAAAATAAASLAYFLAARRADGSYFDTAARAWEFAAGGLAAFAGDLSAAPDAARSALSWAGLAAIAAGAALFPGRALFGGWGFGLPVAGALAVIWAGEPGGPLSPAPLLRARPVQRLGDLSYSLYLWHWPALVLLCRLDQEPSGQAGRCGALAASIAAAALCKRFVEDPLRFGPLLRSRPPRRTFAFAAAGLLAVLGGCACGRWSVERLKASARREADAVLAAGPPPCFGAAAADAVQPCRDPALERAVVPRPILYFYPARSAAYWHVDTSGDFSVRELFPQARPASSVLLVGDSHAYSFREALRELARRRRWRGLAAFGCAAAQTDPPGSACARWNQGLLAWLAAHPEAETVVMAARADRDPAAFAGARDGFLREMRAFPASVRRVIVVRDNPRALDIDCVERALERGDDAGRCADPRPLAEPRDPAVAAAALWDSPRAVVLDLNDLICGGGRCRHVIGGARVFLDGNHLTDVYAGTLAPIVARRLDALERRADARTAARR